MSSTRHSEGHRVADSRDHVARRTDTGSTRALTSSSPAADHTLGQRAWQQLVHARVAQAKLTVSDPGDPYEEEAERVADQVMRMPGSVVDVAASGPSIQRLCTVCEASQLERQPLEEEEPVLQAAVIQRQLPEEELLQAKSTGESALEVTPEMEAAVQSLPGRGEPLPNAVRAFMEPRFKADFGAVRMHADAEAHGLARAVNAQAFTVGSNIVFGAGHYAPDTERGQHLIAHELTHVLQQGAAGMEVAGIRRNEATSNVGPQLPARRRVMIDADVLSQINRGNQPAALKLKELTQTAEVWISQEAYNAAVVNRTHKDMSTANRLLLEELNIKVGPPESVARGAFPQRVDVYDKNIVGPTRGVLSEQLKGQPNLVGGDVFTAAQAKAADAELWSFDRAYRNNAAGVAEKLGIKVAPECQTIAPLSSPGGEDWRTGRRMLGLQEKEILPDGTIVAPRGPGNSGPGPSASEAGKPAAQAEPRLATPKAIEPPARGSTLVPSAPEVTIEPPSRPRMSTPSAIPRPAVNPDALHPVMRALRDLAKIVFSPNVLVPVAVLLEVLNAVQMYAMATGGLSGTGFLFRQHIAQLRGVLEKVGAALTHSRNFSDQLQKSSTVAYVHALAGERAPTDELYSLVIDTEPKLRDRLARWREVRRQALELQLASDRQRKLGEALLASREFHALTAPMGTAAAAIVLGATTDMITIRGLSGDSVKVLDQLILVLEQDLETSVGVIGMPSLKP